MELESTGKRFELLQDYILLEQPVFPKGTILSVVSVIPEGYRYGVVELSDKTFAEDYMALYPEWFRSLEVDQPTQVFQTNDIKDIRSAFHPDLRPHALSVEFSEIISKVNTVTSEFFFEGKISGESARELSGRMVKALYPDQWNSLKEFSPGIYTLPQQ